MFAPFYLCLIYAFKAPSDIVFGKLGPPSYLYLGNISAVLFKNTLFFSALKNSIIVTVPSVLILQVVCSTGAYVLARNQNFICKAIYSLFVASILIPFQSVMLSTYIDLKSVNLINTRLGFVLVRVGFTIAFNSLIITSFVKSIPIALEEAASIDGAGRFTTFWKVVFPLMQPVNLSVLVLNFLFIWDDFGIALIILQKARVRTLPMAQYSYFGEISTDLHGAFAFTFLSMIPVVLLYLFFQKYIVEGVTSGAVKG
jgi:raffinose/stachyose/melibiose transport system permease protein